MFGRVDRDRRFLVHKSGSAIGVAHDANERGVDGRGFDGRGFGDRVGCIHGVVRRRGEFGGGDQPGWQPQAEPQPPIDGGADAGPTEPAGLADPAETEAKRDRSFTVSLWPPGQCAGAEASAIDRLTSNRVSQVRQRYS